MTTKTTLSIPSGSQRSDAAFARFPARNAITISRMTTVQPIVTVGFGERLHSQAMEVLGLLHG